MKLITRAKQLKSEIITLYLVCRHPGTPWYAKVFITAVVAYALSPIDLIPDFIPVLGYLDDIILIPLGIALAIKMVPLHIWKECKDQAGIIHSRLKHNLIVAIIIVLIWIAVTIVATIWVINHFFQ